MLESYIKREHRLSWEFTHTLWIDPRFMWAVVDLWLNRGPDPEKHRAHSCFRLDQTTLTLVRYSCSNVKLGLGRDRDKSIKCVLLFTCRGPGFDVAGAVHHRVLSLSFFWGSKAVPVHQTQTQQWLGSQEQLWKDSTTKEAFNTLLYYWIYLSVVAIAFRLQAYLHTLMLRLQCKSNNDICWCYKMSAFGLY